MGAADASESGVDDAPCAAVAAEAEKGQLGTCPPLLISLRGSRQLGACDRAEFSIVCWPMTRIVVALLAAALIALVIGLWHAGGKNISADQWLLTGVPAWLQGLGTIAAAYVAWVAFGTWRRQEVARSRAELAEKVLHAASELALSIFRARTTKWLTAERSLTEIAAELTGPQSQAHVEEIRALAGRLRSLILAAGHILGSDVSDCVIALLRQAGELVGAHEKILRFAKDEADLDKDVAKENLAILGCRFGLGDDGFGKATGAAYTKLTKALGPRLSYDLKAGDD